MTEHEIICYVNDGANFYLRFFGDASHMEYHINDFYSFIRPKQGEQGVEFVFDVRLENPPEKGQMEIIENIKALDIPVWWDLQASNALFRLMHGREKENACILTDGDELYMAMLPGELHDSGTNPADLQIVKVKDAYRFATWANAVNTIMSGGYADIHPIHHYPWCEKGLIHCFSCYDGDAVVAVAAVMDNDGICSLEFVATAPNYRRKGLAKAVCAEALAYAFDNGARIITLRAQNPGTRELYTALGFRTYNHAL